MKPLTHRPIPPFVKSLWRMVTDESPSSSCISWTSDGKGFVVHDRDQFAVEILPKYFKHSNFTSFTRQVRLSSTIQGRWSLPCLCALRGPVRANHLEGTQFLVFPRVMIVSMLLRDLLVVLDIAFLRSSGCALHLAAQFLPVRLRQLRIWRFARGGMFFL